jgi:hypothetical protein
MTTLNLNQKWLTILPGNAVGEAVEREYGKPITHQQEFLVEALTELDDKIRTINAGSTFSPSGKREQAVRLGKEAAATITAESASRRKKFEADQRGLSRPRFPRPKDLLEFSQQREIRDRLLALKPEARTAAIQSAVLSDSPDTDLLVAVVNAPKAFPLASEQLTADALDAYYRATHPAEYEATRTVTAALRLHDSNLAAALREIEKLTGAPVASDPAGFSGASNSGKRSGEAA